MNQMLGFNSLYLMKKMYVWKFKNKKIVNKLVKKIVSNKIKKNQIMKNNLKIK